MHLWPGVPSPSGVHRYLISPLYSPRCHDQDILVILGVYTSSWLQCLLPACLCMRMQMLIIGHFGHLRRDACQPHSQNRA